MSKKADSGLADERPFWGVHILATAMLCAKGSSADELELARRILERDPRVDAPRESESIAGAFNRHMDAALDSANDSLGDPSRASRRAMLARDLDRAGLVLMDRSQVADLIGAINALREELDDAATGEDLGTELASDALLEEIDLQRSIDEEQVDRYYRDPLGLERGELNPSVND